jgi:single-strand DNA-binding protein
MALNLNTVLLAGHLTRDPEVKVLAKERTVAAFSIAINRRYKGSDGEFKEESTFVDCEAWGRTAELVGQYLAKGSGCYVEGRLKLDTWQDKEGAKKSRLKVVVDSVQFLSRPRGEEGSAGSTDSEAVASAPTKNAPRPGKRPQPAAVGDGEDQPPF